MTDTPFLIGDIGGTHARFALGTAGQPGYHDESTLPCKHYGSPEAAIGAYLEQVNSPSPGIICLAAAGPVSAGEVRLTNHPWHLVAQSLSDTFSGASVRLLNDFEAVAYCLPLLGPDDCMTVGQIDLRPTEAGDLCYCALGPGTGLGGAGLRRVDGIEVPIVSELGHTGFAPQSAIQIGVLERLQDRFGRVSNERILCGSGLTNLHMALAQLKGAGSPQVMPADIFRLDNEGHALATETVDLFLEILGQVSGDLVLAYGAWDGAFIAGGMLPRYPARILRSPFRQGFENKGRFSEMLSRVPSVLVTHPQPGLLGACAVAIQLQA